MTATDMIARIFYKDVVAWEKQGGRTATGRVSGSTVDVLCSVNTTATVTVTDDGREVTAVATVSMTTKNGLPQVGDHMTLPPKFGIRPMREVVAVQNADSGIPSVPNHVIVRLK